MAIRAAVDHDGASEIIVVIVWGLVFIFVLSSRGWDPITVDFDVVGRSDEELFRVGEPQHHLCTQLFDRTEDFERPIPFEALSPSHLFKDLFEEFHTLSKSVQQLGHLFLGSFGKLCDLLFKLASLLKVLGKLPQGHLFRAVVYP